MPAHYLRRAMSRTKARSSRSRSERTEAWLPDAAAAAPVSVKKRDQSAPVRLPVLGARRLVERSRRRLRVSVVTDGNDAHDAHDVDGVGGDGTSWSVVDRRAAVRHARALGRSLPQRLVVVS